MRQLPILAFLLLSTTVFSQPQLGIQKIIQGQFYVVHSGMDSSGTVFESSNCYLIKGTNDTVWVFGTGYGDKTVGNDKSDLSQYKGGGVYEPTLNAIDDVRKADSVIIQEFGISKSNCVLMFIVPHGHLDHINQEFISAFFDSLSYPNNGTQIYVHTNDHKTSTCNSYLCGTGKQAFYGAPFHRPWTGTELAMFVQLGKPADATNLLVRSFTSACGNWSVVKGDTLHTRGSLNLDNPGLKYRILGSAPDGAPTGQGWKKLPIHGDVKLTQGIYETGLHQGIHFYPNPAANELHVELNEQDVLLEVFNLVGQTVLTGTNLKAGHSVIDTSTLPSGLYFVRFTGNEGSLGAEKLFIR